VSASTLHLPPLHYVKTGDHLHISYFTLGDGPPLVFASNIFGDVHSYCQLARHHVRGVTDGLVALGWKVIRHDVRGMGSSDRTVDDFSLPARVSDLEAVVDGLGLERFALAGVDLGAATAIAFAARNANRVSRLVLLSPWISGADMFALPDVRVATAAIARGHREWEVFTNVLATIAHSFEDVSAGMQLATSMRQSTTPECLAQYYKESESIDLTHLLPHLIMPTLVIHEPFFPFGSLDLCREVAKKIPNASFVVVNDKSIAGTVHDGNIFAMDGFLRSRTADPSGAVPVLSAAPPTVTGTRLTAREVQVLRRVAGGLTNKEIATTLGVAAPTVERHLVNLYTKIGARGRVDATAYAIRNGLAKTSSPISEPSSLN
jgi:pimeloyl-ACP methyl ester carboxylesterase/DNA-binding CsgD family transcriptional regulator